MQIDERGSRGQSVGAQPLPDANVQKQMIHAWLDMTSSTCTKLCLKAPADVRVARPRGYSLRRSPSSLIPSIMGARIKRNNDTMIVGGKTQHSPTLLVWSIGGSTQPINHFLEGTSTLPIITTGKLVNSLTKTMRALSLQREHNASNRASASHGNDRTGDIHHEDRRPRRRRPVQGVGECVGRRPLADNLGSKLGRVGHAVRSQRPC